ncbi:MAG TPA: hypothetical protein EYG86_00625 [Crocinitomicaceae bacterium]|nr:hypothetical protein [Crocinitomicaceae bacterium]
MKNLFLLTISFLSYTYNYSQTNLVKNGSFENFNQSIYIAETGDVTVSTDGSNPRIISEFVTFKADIKLASGVYFVNIESNGIYEHFSLRVE